MYGRAQHTAVQSNVGNSWKNASLRLQGYTWGQATVLVMQSVLQLLLPAILPVRFACHVLTLAPLLWSAVSTTSQVCSLLAAAGAPPSIWDRTFGSLHSVLSANPDACLLRPGGPWWAPLGENDIAAVDYVGTAVAALAPMVPAGTGTVPGADLANCCSSAATAGECPSPRALCMQGHTWLLFMNTFLGIAGLYLVELNFRLQFAADRGFLVEPWRHRRPSVRPLVVVAIVAAAGGFLWKLLELVYQE